MGTCPDGWRHLGNSMPCPQFSRRSRKIPDSSVKQLDRPHREQADDGRQHGAMARRAGRGFASHSLGLRGWGPTMRMAKVLLVDANQDRRASLSRALVGAGYEVATAPSGASSAGALESERPDLVVSYAQVQDMDGYELFTLVRKDPTTMDTPFLLLAGRDRPVALAAAEAGVDMTMTGDFTHEMVVGRVGDVLKPGTGADLSWRAGTLEGNGARRSAEPLWTALESVAARRPEAATGADFQGSLDVMDLAEVTQAVALGGKTGRLVVSLAAGEAMILFENGRLVHAAFGGRTGEQAFATVI